MLELREIITRYQCMLKRTRPTYIVSDLHFGHSNIIKYCNRPYHVEGSNKNPANIPEVNRMNEEILQMFDFLPENCDIWNLGDVFFAGSGRQKEYLTDAKIEELKKIVARMKKGNRRLFLVLGNHDNVHFEGHNRLDYYYKLGFDKVYDSPVIVEDKYILSHEPVYIAPGSNFINLYGHTHDIDIDENYFCIDYENYAMEKRVFDSMGQKEPEAVIRFPERKIELKNYKNMCLDKNKGILKWESDYFNTAAMCWRNSKQEDKT